MDHIIRLVEATKEDIPTLLGFLSELFKLEADFRPDHERQAVALELILDTPEHATIYVVKVGEETAGMIALHLSISTAEGGWCGRIEDVYVKPQFRRQGIGRNIMGELVVIARNKGLKRLTLMADKTNLPALQFYSVCGFEEMNLVSFIRRIT
ncbi:MAG TPA: GNAT family N-acetyltransferase [Anaerolineae bacterium]|nr:GNAT family N-acetyltransferase [Anaerolineae bacterium]